MTLRASVAPSEPELCPSVRRGKKEKITMLRVIHVPYRGWRRACVAGRGRSDAHLTSRTLVSATGDIGRAGGKTLPNPGHEVVDHAGDVQGHSASLV